MIEIQLSNGDWAEAETPEAAMVAALTMHDDATRGRYGGRSRDLTATFINAETREVILSGISRPQMLRHA